ncbi:40s ribosomal protein SA [Trebouxia sp. C0010 RCD-2024]
MALSQKESDIQLMLAASCHLGTKNCDYQMERYVYRRRLDGIYVINLGKTWEKLQLAARIIVAIENPQDIVVQSARPYGQRAVLKFAQYTGAKALAGRHTPGTFTNQIQKVFEEPRLLLLTDPRTDHQPIKESAYVNIPTIAFCDTDSPLPYVDIAIPANNKAKHSIGVLYWILARMVLQMRSTLLPGQPWDVMVDLFFYREPEETKEPGEEDAADYGGDNQAYGALPAPGGVPDQSWDESAPAGAGFGQDAPAPPAADDWGSAPAAGAADGWDAAPAPAPQQAQFASADQFGAQY